MRPDRAIFGTGGAVFGTDSGVFGTTRTKNGARQIERFEASPAPAVPIAGPLAQQAPRRQRGRPVSGSRVHAHARIAARLPRLPGSTGFPHFQHWLGRRLLAGGRVLVRPCPRVERLAPAIQGIPSAEYVAVLPSRHLNIRTHTDRCATWEEARSLCAYASRGG